MSKRDGGGGFEVSDDVRAALDDLETSKAEDDDDTTLSGSMDRNHTTPLGSEGWSSDPAPRWSPDDDRETGHDQADDARETSLYDAGGGERDRGRSYAGFTTASPEEPEASPPEPGVWLSNGAGTNPSSSPRFPSPTGIIGDGGGAAALKAAAAEKKTSPATEEPPPIQPTLEADLTTRPRSKVGCVVLGLLAGLLLVVVTLGLIGAVLFGGEDSGGGTAQRGVSMLTLRPGTTERVLLDRSTPTLLVGGQQRSARELTLTIDIPATYRLTLNAMSEGDPFLSVLDGGGTEVARDDDGGEGLNASLDVPLSPGTYRVRAASAQQLSGPTTFFLGVSAPPTASPAASTAGAPSPVGSSWGPECLALRACCATPAFSGYDSIRGQCQRANEDLAAGRLNETSCLGRRQGVRSTASMLSLRALPQICY